MRCLACDCELTDYESTRKDPLTGQYSDLCSGCILSVQDIVRELDEPVVREICITYDKGIDDIDEI